MQQKHHKQHANTARMGDQHQPLAYGLGAKSGQVDGQRQDWLTLLSGKEYENEFEPEDLPGPREHETDTPAHEVPRVPSKRNW